MRRFLLVLAGGLMLTGCSAREKVGEVHGQVTVNGHPLSAGKVIFMKDDESVSVFGDLDADGRFRLSTFKYKNGLPIGKYLIAVQPRGGNPEVEEMPLAEQALKSKELSSPFPAKYYDPQKSGLTAEIGEGNNPPILLKL